MPIHEFASKFRSLAAASGWDESPLLTTYHQGLEARLRLHLSAYDDTMGLERFIQLSIRVASHMHSCMKDQQSLTHSNLLLHRPENISPPEPVSEPMLVDNTRLPLTEGHRRLSQGLCLYCGASGHTIATCLFVHLGLWWVPLHRRSPICVRSLRLCNLLLTMFLSQLLPSSTPAQRLTSSQAPSVVSSTFPPRTPRRSTRSSQ